MKKKLLVGIMSFLAVAFVSSAAVAEVYENLNVRRAQSNATGTALMLETTEGSGSYTWYSIPTGTDDQSLAIALTAISLGKTVRVGKPTAGSTTLTFIALNGI